MMKHRRISFSLILGMFLVLGCSTPSSDQSVADPVPTLLERRFNLGGAPIDLIVGLSAESLDLTEFLTVTVRIEHEEGVQVEPPYLSEAVYAPLVLVRQPKEDLSWSEKRHRIIKTWEYRLEPMQSGEFHLQPFRVFFRLESEKQPDRKQWPIYKINTEPIPYRVTSVELGEQADIRDLKDLILPPFHFLPVGIVVLVLGILPAVGLMIIRIGNRLQNGNTTSAEVIDYLAESLKRLDELEERDYISQREYERLHIELSSIMRYFIENRFGMRALEQTTEEFIRAIQYSPHFGTEQQAILRQFMELADLVKFATYDPGSNASREAMKTVRYFVESTRHSHED